MELKRGYIEVFVIGIDSFIMDSNGFGFEDLSSINSQIQEPEEFENVKEGIYVFKPVYSIAEKDHMGRVTVPSYWLLEEDEYTKKMNKQIKKEFDEYHKDKEGDSQ